MNSTLTPTTPIYTPIDTTQHKFNKLSNFIDLAINAAHKSSQRERHGCVVIDMKTMTPLSVGYNHEYVNQSLGENSSRGRESKVPSSQLNRPNQFRQPKVSKVSCSKVPDALL